MIPIFLRNFLKVTFLSMRMLVWVTEHSVALVLWPTCPLLSCPSQSSTLPSGTHSVIRQTPIFSASSANYSVFFTLLLELKPGCSPRKPLALQLSLGCSVTLPPLDPETGHTLLYLFESYAITASNTGFPTSYSLTPTLCSSSSLTLLTSTCKSPWSPLGPPIHNPEHFLGCEHLPPSSL